MRQTWAWWLALALLALALAFLLPSSIPVSPAVHRLLGIPLEGPIQAKPLEVDEGPLRAAGRRVLQPLGIVRLNRVLPETSPTATPAAN